MDAAMKTIKLKSYSIVLFTFCSIKLKIESFSNFLKNTDVGLAPPFSLVPLVTALLPQASPGLHYVSVLLFLEELQLQILSSTSEINIQMMFVCDGAKLE
jgi:hypothetical protein